MTQLKATAKQLILRWFQNLWNAAVQGGANATLAAMGLAGASSLGVQVQPLDYKQTGAIFVAGAVIEILRFLRNKPSPDLEGSVKELTYTSNETEK